MIEVTVFNYLKKAMPDITVTMEIRQDMPDSYIFVEKVGSSMKDRLPSSRFAIQSYAPSLVEAIMLNERVKEVMEGLVAEPEITAVRLNSDYNYTDTVTKKPRYQAIFEVTHY